jgi:hypothetical protein
MTKFKLACFLGMICLLFWGCGEQQSPNVETIPKPAEPKTPAPIAHPVFDAADTVDNEDRIAGDFKGNYIWSGAMNLAWNELCTKVTQGKPSYVGQDPTSERIVRVYNHSGFSSIDLDSSSFLVKTGLGPQVFKTVRREMKERFPKGKLKIPEIPVRSDELFLFAYLLKALEFEVPFDSGTVDFLGKPVKGFCAKSYLKRKNVEIMDYTSDDQFLLRIKLAQPVDQLWLAKGLTMDTPNEVLKALNRIQKSNPERMRDDDHFQAPNLKMDFNRELLPKNGIDLKDSGDMTLHIADMQEWITFEMDAVGARVENLARIGPIPTAISPPGPLPKNLLLNKPYWVIMKRKDSPRPYLILGVRNTAMMKAAD